jgi:hypothetical protein
MSLWPSLEKFQASTPYGVGSAHKDVGVNILTGVQKVGQVRSLAHLARAALLALSRLCSLLSLAALAPCRPSSLRAVLTPVRGRVGIVIAQVRLARLINHDPKCYLDSCRVLFSVTAYASPASWHTRGAGASSAQSRIRTLPTRRAYLREILLGVEVPDPYRWLENGITTSRPARHIPPLCW